MTREHLSRGRIFRCGLAAVVLMDFLLAAGCSRSAAVEPGKEEVKRSYTKGQLMTIAATERNRYQNIYTSQIWSVEDKTGGGNFEDRLTGQIRQFFMELGTMNLLADENGIELTSQEKDSIKRLSEQYYGLLSKADRDYIGADQEEVYELYCEYYRADKLVTELTQDQNLEISDAEAKVIEVLPISVRNRQTAEEVLAQAQAEGADFSAIAKKYSTDGGVAVQMERNQNQSELEKAAFALEQDEISGIVEENGAFYILKCTNAYDEAATAARKKKLAQEKKNNAFQKIYAPFADSHVVVFDEKMWSEIHFEGGEGSTTTNFFELYHSYFPK